MNKFLGACFVFVSIMILFTAVAVQAARPGVFDNADFFTPDYNNGGSETFDVGESRTFNYNCYCTDQPGNSACNGYIKLQVDTGSGFVDEKSGVCNIGESETCSASYTKTFDAAGTYKFRVFCDENAGTDYTQPASKYVILTVEDTCNDGDARLCPLQSGVCEGSTQTCSGGSWLACDYGPSYGNEEAFGCDGFDNDCNGVVDDVDNDGDGSSPCGGMGVVNELLIHGLNGDYGQIDVFAYDPSTSSYESVWSTDTPGIGSAGAGAGGEIGDITHDGVNDFIITRKDNSGDSQIEVWSYDSQSKEWYRVWLSNFGNNQPVYVGDIGDFDNDGFEEFLFSDAGADTIEVWGNDVAGATSFSQEALIRACTNNAIYPDAAGDLNGNGILEIVFQCDSSTNIEILEWNGVDYELKGSVPAPSSMLIDDMECNGDVNMDGVIDCVFCGNSGTSHVLTYMNGSYFIDYSAPATGDSSFTQTCSIGDIDNDGYADWFDSSQGGGLRVFSYKNGYQQVWNYPDHGENPPIGGSFVGDSDNDGRGEFLVTYTSDYRVELWESDEVGATSFTNTFTWSPSSYFSSIIIGNLNPYNDEGGMDCDDNDGSVYPGAPEICGDGVDQDCDGADAVCNCIDGDLDGYYGYDQVSCPVGDDCNDNDYYVNPGAEEVCDGIDNNCDGTIDEGCGPVCGDGYCDGLAYGEDCRSCPQDCPSGDKGVCCGDGKCDTRKGETASFCPVDCS